MKKIIYLDNAATTKVAPEVVAVSYTHLQDQTGTGKKYLLTPDLLLAFPFLFQFA